MPTKSKKTNKSNSTSSKSTKSKSSSAKSKTAMGSKTSASKSKMPARGTAKGASQVDDNMDLEAADMEEDFDDEDEA